MSANDDIELAELRATLSATAAAVATGQDEIERLRGERDERTSIIKGVMGALLDAGCEVGSADDFPAVIRDVLARLAAATEDAAQWQTFADRNEELHRKLATQFTGHADGPDESGRTPFDDADCADRFPELDAALDGLIESHAEPKCKTCHDTGWVNAPRHVNACPDCAPEVESHE